MRGAHAEIKVMEGGLQWECSPKHCDDPGSEGWHGGPSAVTLISVPQTAPNQAWYPLMVRERESGWVCVSLLPSSLFPLRAYQTDTFSPYYAVPIIFLWMFQLWSQPLPEWRRGGIPAWSWVSGIRCGHANGNALWIGRAVPALKKHTLPIKSFCTPQVIFFTAFAL